MFLISYDLICYILIGLNVLFMTFGLYTYLTTSRVPIIRFTPQERAFYDPRTESRFRFPSLDDEWTIHLSVIIPAFDEECRLPPMLDECLEYLQNRPHNFRYEVIIVSDGSRDRTVDISLKYVNKYGTSRIRVMKLLTNRGKGGAVRLGMQCARGAVLLFADADGATKFSDLSKLEASLTTLTEVNYKSKPAEVAEKLAIVCGSRAHLQRQATATRSYFRTILMYGFHSLVWLFAVRGIQDTQCGFKLLTRAAARLCFRSLHVEGCELLSACMADQDILKGLRASLLRPLAFDVEMLYIAETLKIPVSEVPVRWIEVEVNINTDMKLFYQDVVLDEEILKLKDGSSFLQADDKSGSKIVPVLSWIQMGRDVVLIWFKYLIGAWTIQK